MPETSDPRPPVLADAAARPGGDRVDLEPAMAALEARLQDLVRSRVEFIELIGEDLVSAGGKRFRPRLVFLAARALQRGEGPAAPDPREVDFAAAIELLHSATLLHDDLVDDAETRRGHEAAFRRYGNAVSVLSGDFLLSRVLKVLATFPPEFTDLVAETSMRICEGEVLQFQVAALETYGLEHYLDVITGKTAVLVAAATRGAAMIKGASPEVVRALDTFGLEYGRAFQMMDDLLDLVSDPAVLGKPTGGDLREGKATLPVLYLLEDGHDEVRAVLARRARLDDDVALVRDLALAPGAGGAPSVADRVRAEIRRRAAIAVEALQVLPASAARAELEQIAWRAAERVS
jgi:octaprenyl-diphosphate synthase